ncbi:MAG: histidine phosphatase family protein [Kofleriaceae bacterium]
MSWRKLTVVADGSHHVDERGVPAYVERFDEVLKFHAPGLAPVRRGGLAWHITEDGAPAYERRFNRTFGFYEGLATVVDADGWHQIRVDGGDAYPQRYAWTGNVQGGRCPVREDDGSYLHIDVEGRASYAARWKYAGDFRDGVAVVQASDGRSTHIGQSGARLHECWFLDLDVFHKGFARARDRGGWTHVDVKGQPLYARRFAAVEPFYNGQARVERFDGGLEVIGERGERIVELRPARRSEFAALSRDLVGFWRTDAIAAAVEVGVLEALPGHTMDLARRLALRADRLGALLRGLTELSLVRRTGGMWSLTERGRFLLQDDSRTLADAAREYAGPIGARRGGTMTEIAWVIPPSTLAWLEQVPRDRPVAMLVRHSVRGHLAPGDVGYTVPITEVGHQLAHELGTKLQGRLQTVYASPLLRTMQTGRRLAEGAARAPEVVPDRMLGDPGVFVVDGRAGGTWQALGHEEVMRRLVHGDEVLPGCADADAAARALAQHMLALSSGAPGVHAFVTHDSLVTATAARLLGEALTKDDWPWYLEAAFFWEQADGVHVAYRDRHRVLPSPLVHLTHADVIALARREIAATLGLDCRARFFLAGGAFKTLLSGRPPRDLDVWAASQEDRAVVENRLLERGARQLPEQPYTRGFRLNGRVVELSLHTEPSVLEDRLARFDLALSAIGAEHRPADQWRAAIHPRAHASAAGRQVLLLEDLLNWKHALASLVRLRSYASELGFEVPASEEQRLWKIFDAQPPEMRRGMLERFRASTRFDPRFAEEASCRP